MVYLLGGPPRAGKTTAAHRFTARTGISHFSIDYLKMGLVRGLPDYGVDVYNDRETATKLWPILRGMVHTYVEEREDILIEGYYMLPGYAARLRADLGDRVSPCFIGFCDVPTLEKVRELREYSPGGWSSEDDREANDMAEHLQARSREIRDDCARHDLPYFECPADHEATMAAAVDYLVGRVTVAHGR